MAAVTIDAGPPYCYDMVAFMRVFMQADGELVAFTYSPMVSGRSSIEKWPHSFEQQPEFFKWSLC